MAEKSRRGFAAMDAAKQRAIASKGGKAAHAQGRAHEFTPEQAREAGRKGGLQAHAKRTAHRFTSEEAQEAARLRNAPPQNPDTSAPAACPLPGPEPFPVQGVETVGSSPTPCQPIVVVMDPTVPHP